MSDKQTTAHDTSNAIAFVARQPILDRSQDVYGYELLFRDDMTNAANITDHDVATSRVILNSFVDIGIDKLVGRHMAFINMPRNLLLNHHEFPFPNTQVGLEVLENIEIDDSLLTAVQELSARGFTIALDDFYFRQNSEALIELADIVKVDIQEHSRDSLEKLVKHLRQYQVLILAEKVESRQEYIRCADLGFDYFQGYYLCEPEIIKEQTLPDNKLNVLRLLAEIDKPETGPKELEALIRNDVSLTYKLLRCVNSAYFGVPLKIQSLSHAIVYLGLNTIRNWARLLTLAGLDDRPSELIKLALTRAHMCELVLDNLSNETKQTAFTVGLFSLLDALMGLDMSNVLSRVSLSDDITDALVDSVGPYGNLLDTIRNYERANWDAVEQSRYTREQLTEAYLEAIAWADEVFAVASGITAQ